MYPILSSTSDLVLAFRSHYRSAAPILQRILNTLDKMNL